MSFLTILALGIGLFVAAPYVAHRLRRQRAEERPFAPARLVPPSPPKARRRARLEDRPLFAIRAAAIVALALLGASPLARCSRLSLSRGGASVAVAIVIDDSMSMRVVDASGRSRFSRARQGAAQILSSLQEGDAAAIVLAGAPARVGLAATTDIGAAKNALEGLGETDRATDLDGAIAIAKTLVGELPQIDRRVIVLSDLADGKSDAPPLGEGAGLPVWIAMPELATEATDDCGVLGADRTGSRVRVRVACSSAKAAAGRDVVMKSGERVVASAKLPETLLGEVTLAIEGEGKDGSANAFVELTGKDAIASDDRATIVVESGPAALAVVGDRPETAVATGGAPVVEQALAALHLEMAVRPLPEAPDRREDMAAFAAIVFDDPPGFTPEQRRALGELVERGGVVLLALGRRSAVAPLGASFEPFLAQAVSWSAFAEGSRVSGVDPKGASGATFFGESAASLADLAPKGRAKIGDADAQGYERLLDWSDGAPFVLRRARGRGEVWITTLPFSVDASDLALRPGFLALLDAFVGEAKQRAAPRRSDVGVPWSFNGATKVVVEGPKGPIPTALEGGTTRAVPELIGSYTVKAFGTQELRVAAALAREIDLRPRKVAGGAAASNLGGGVAIVDISWVVALILLAIVAAEILVRAFAGAGTGPTASIPFSEATGSRNKEG